MVKGCIFSELYSSQFCRNGISSHRYFNFRMVKLHVKYGDESQFLLETNVCIEIEELLKDILEIYNGRLKVKRICNEIEDMAKYGVFLPPRLHGLTDEQIKELHLKDEWTDKFISPGSFVQQKDPIGRRNGKAPVEKIAEVLRNTSSESKARISKKLVLSDICLTQADIKDALDMLQGAVMIAYPMGLPPYDPVKQELENQEDLAGTQASLEVIEEALAQLWWAGKELQRGKKLYHYIGKNEKTKLVVKLQKRGHGAPAREPVISAEENKKLMLLAYRRQEELKKLEDAEDDSYLNAEWADSSVLKKSFQGLKNIKWHPH